MKLFRFALLLCSLAAAALAADKEHATLIREGALSLKPAADAEKVISLGRGTDLVVLERSGNPPGDQWLRVFATLGGKQGEPMRELSGWLPAKVVLAASTPNADQIIYGEAADSEQQAEQRGGRKGAADDAMRLYRRVAELFPQSPLAGESLWRSADIRWQLDKAKGGNNADDQYLKEVTQKFPHTKWADLAAYDLLDTQLCGDWKGLASCPQREAELYETYARAHPQSSKAAEALFNAAWRQGVLVDIFRISGDKDKSSAARKKALALAQEVANLPAQTDWKARAIQLVYKLEQSLPLYGVEEQAQ